MNSTFYEFINLYIAAFGLINKKLCIRFLRQMFRHHYTKTEYLNGTDPVIDSMYAIRAKLGSVRHIKGSGGG